MKVALVYDRLNKVGGAEQVLIAFHEIFPEADWYTSVSDIRRLPFSARWKIHNSWLNNVPFFRHNHELIPYLMPFAFEAFDFNGYDIVISIGSAECKGIITRPETFHLNYCLTPTRYLWSHFDSYAKNLPGLFRRWGKALMITLRKWDLVAATRPDEMISISEHVKSRVKKYYNRITTVIYPPVDLKKLTLSEKKQNISPLNDNYYLVVSRLVSYKNIDLIIRTFNQNGENLIIVGTGKEEKRLKKIAKDNIKFVGYVEDNELLWYFRHCTAFIQANIEDFGIAMVEALAAGKPVIAYNDGGAPEIVNSETGVLYNEMSASSLQQALSVLKRKQIKREACLNQAKKFDKERWKILIKERIMVTWENHKKAYA